MPTSFPCGNVRSMFHSTGFRSNATVRSCISSAGMSVSFFIVRSFKCVSQSGKSADALDGGVVIGCVKCETLRVVHRHVFVKGIKRSEQGIFRNKVQKVFKSRVDLKTVCECLRELNIHEREPGRLRRTKIVRYHGKIHRSVQATRKVD